MHGLSDTKNLLRGCFLILFAAAVSFSANAQNQTFRGRIVNSRTGEPVTFANIENFSQHTTVISDTSGIFNIRAVSGDTLVLSAIGFFYKMAVVTDSLMASSMPRLEIDERIYDLEEATIYHPGTYENFKKDFLELDIPETETDILRENLADVSRNEGLEAYEQAKASGELDMGLTPVMKILTADEKARIRLKKAIEKDAIRNMIYEKYNVDIVKQVTGMTDESEVVSFMFFCDFPEDYLLEVNPLDLAKRISEKYEDWKKEHGAGSMERSAQGTEDRA